LELASCLESSRMRFCRTNSTAGSWKISAMWFECGKSDSEGIWRFSVKKTRHLVIAFLPLDLNATQRKTLEKVIRRLSALRDCLEAHVRG
jgi:hypothetical protein